MTRREAEPPEDPPVPAVTEQPMPTAQHLVAAWVDGFREKRNTDPHPTLIRRVAGQAKSIAKDCKTIEHWRTAWRAAVAGGRAGKVGFGMFLADEQPRSLYAKPSPVSLLAAHRARAFTPGPADIDWARQATNEQRAIETGE